MSKTAINDWLITHAQLCENDGCPDEAAMCMFAADEINRLRTACEMLVAWADYGGDAVAMLDDAVAAAKEALA